MTLLNYNYIDFHSLKKFIGTNSIPNTNSVLIQIFYSNTDVNSVYSLREELLSILPNASLIVTSTAGTIADGSINDSGMSISFSVFESSSTKSMSYCSLSNNEIIERLSKDLITDRTKLLLLYANTFLFDSESLLKKITQEYPNIVIAGGNAGDDFKFEKCEIFSHTCNDCNVVFAAVDSDVLEVQTKFLFNWQTIGKELTITKCEGNRVYEIDNKRVIDIYSHYLGEDVVENILVHGTEFPLIFQDNGTDVGRAPIIAHEDGSLTFRGAMYCGQMVKFGYANVDFINQYNKQKLLNEMQYKNEAIYIYSCSARRSMLGTFLDEEVEIINNLAPTSGFVTYGEFFHDAKSCSNNLLNITTTYVILNEGQNNQKKLTAPKTSKTSNAKDITLKALTTLISKTSEELDGTINYLEQFRHAVDEASIFSVADKKGIIKDVNKNFEIISGYTKEELIGKPHNIVRHQDVSSEVFKDMWETIQSGKSWKGLVKNRRKDGSPYYVLSEITPIYNKDGSFKEYIGIRNDVTELEEYKHILKNELDTTNKSLEDNLNYTAQYEDAINTTTAILKTDTNNIIKYANERFCELSGYSLEKLIGKNCEELRHEKHRETQKCAKIREKLQSKQIVQEIMTNVTKDKQEFVVNNLFYPIIDLKGNIVEVLQIMYDITEIITLNEEITNTQREVVMTMGAIGETRSKETGQHVKRVAEYSYLLAKLAGLSEEDALLLKQASPMHDIGKVGIPDSILNKPGKLTFEEFETMKTHSSIGYEMLKHSNRQILQASALVARTHHEKWNGTGYPNSLEGEDIPIFGRITAVADVFDALGHDRVYKKAWELKDILNLFKQESGKHFDPNLINLFFEDLDEFLALRNQYEDA
ncbi:PAS domain S-box protein [Candidatus Sulfurimonas baltica]|uniref:PAS domain S-box protein n=1 Tax=Candidatus Sulfurimonas baltica TaxID=2740404 RepID=A0A7S7LSZ8_9BACT|nr:PAS domain S-box protein [Candidatus Sulfurimonas baltica]QOY50979.1 PAS domain S-box protein [Candidatus Sulfurimonas baltica]